jgi:hypothetical protein
MALRGAWKADLGYFIIWFGQHMKLSPKQLKDLAHELDWLSLQQSTALETAVYVHMSKEEAAQCDLRRARMTEIHSLLCGGRVR